jgi:hypothetical protein
MRGFAGLEHVMISFVCHGPVDVAGYGSNFVEMA